MGAFHAYDIRGLWGSEVTSDLAYKVGRAYARFSKARTVLVGHDARLHSAQLYARVIDGLLDEGCTVTGIGLASTPQMHFFQMKEKCSGGIMVTASHNPKDYHGFKLFDEKGGSVSYEKGLDKIEAMTTTSFAAPETKRGTLTEKKLLAEYVDFIAAQAHGKELTRPVVIDVTNGSSGPVFEALVKKLKLNAVLLNKDPDGSFPNHDPNPLKEESRIQIREKVLAVKAACGVLLDGDGDRIIFIDDKGEAIENYFMSALIAEELLTENPGASIVYDLISSKVLPEHIGKLGGKGIVSKVGYTFIYDKMVESGAVFGAETSGHVYFKVDDFYYTESAAYAMVIVLAFLEASSAPLSGLLLPLRSRYFQTKEMNVKAQDKDKALALIKERYQDGSMTTLDGISISYPDFWFNVRPSNTEPLIRVRLEAKNSTIALQKTEEIGKLLQGV
jgi:phosphomannomutase